MSTVSAESPVLEMINCSNSSARLSGPGFAALLLGNLCTRKAWFWSYQKPVWTPLQHLFRPTKIVYYFQSLHKNSCKDCVLFLSEVTNLRSGNNKIMTHPLGIYSHALLTWTQTTACSVHPLARLPPRGPTSELFHFQTNKERKIKTLSRYPEVKRISIWHQKNTFVKLYHIFPRVQRWNIFQLNNAHLTISRYLFLSTNW